eukprot:COSAG06_NODE_9107_length_1984_cov_2.653581_2_plen_196_part_00
MLVPASATPNLDAARRGAVRGNPQLTQILANVTDRDEIGEQEDEATRRVTAAEVRPDLRVYLDDYANNLDVAYRAMQDPDNFDKGQALSGIMQALPLFTADNGASSEPTIVAANYDAPTELGGADVHDTAFLFAYTLGDSKGIRQHHMGSFTCAAGQELLLFGVQNGSVVNTHRTGLQSIANIDEYLAVCCYFDR